MASQEVLWPIYQIQKLDAQIALLQRARGALDDGAALAAEVTQHRGDILSLQESLRQVDRAIRERELELASLEEKLQKVEAILYSGKVTNPKELRGYEGERESLRRRRERLEEETLIRMEEKDSLNERLAAAQKVEKEAYARWQAHVAKFRADVAALDAKYAKLVAERDEVRARADSELLRRYDQLARQRKQLVGLVEQNACGACGMLLPARLVKEYQVNPDAEITCPTCAAHLLWRLPAAEPARPA
jgi:predicted  nucleic acid-binding Zn-ribbon protein